MLRVTEGSISIRVVSITTWFVHEPQRYTTLPQYSNGGSLLSERIYISWLLHRITFWIIEYSGCVGLSSSAQLVQCLVISQVSSYLCNFNNWELKTGMENGSSYSRNSRIWCVVSKMLKSMFLNCQPWCLFLNGEWSLVVLFPSEIMKQESWQGHF